MSCMYPPYLLPHLEKRLDDPLVIGSQSVFSESLAD